MLVCEEGQLWQEENAVHRGAKRRTRLDGRSGRDNMSRWLRAPASSMLVWLDVRVLLSTNVSYVIVQGHVIKGTFAAVCSWRQTRGNEK